MKKFFFIIFILWSSVTGAKVINVEFKFTPFTVVPNTKDHILIVPGKAQVFLNNILIGQREITQREDTDDKDIFLAPVLTSIESRGAIVFKGKNKIKIEFTPTDTSKKYQARLAWANIMDQSIDTETNNMYTSTNQSGQGKEEKTVQGNIVWEKDFIADFATDFPWHHYSPITTLSDSDKEQLKQLINSRIALFKPPFNGVYKLMSSKSKSTKLHKSKCLDKVYKAGIHIFAENIDFSITGTSAVVIKGKTDNLFSIDTAKFAKIKGECQQLVGFSLLEVYPLQMIVTRNPSGSWEIVPITFM